MKPFSQTFLGKSLADKGEPSSKRLSGFILLICALVMEFLTLTVQIFNPEYEGVDIFLFDSLLVSGLTALGISAAQRIKESKNGNKTPLQ